MAHSITTLFMWLRGLCICVGLYTNPLGVGLGSHVEHDVQTEGAQHGKTRPFRHPISTQTRAKGEEIVIRVFRAVHLIFSPPANCTLKLQSASSSWSSSFSSYSSFSPLPHLHNPNPPLSLHRTCASPSASATTSPNLCLWRRPPTSG